jgi:hypothetical protein
MDKKDEKVLFSDLKTGIERFVKNCNQWRTNEDHSFPGLEASMSQHLHRKLAGYGNKLSTFWLGLDMSNQGLFSSFSTQEVQTNMTLLVQCLCTYVNALTFKEKGWPQPEDMKHWPYVDFFVWLHVLSVEQWNSVMLWFEKVSEKSK